MNFQKFLLFPFLLLQLEGTYSAKILFFGAMGTHSTRISQWPLMEALADKGHSVTFLSSLSNFELDPTKTKIKMYEPKILVETMDPILTSDMNFYDLRKDKFSGGGWFEMFEYGTVACEALYSDPDFLEWVKSNTFDLIVVESFLNECGYGLVHHWNAKLISYSTASVMPWLPDAFGLPDETSSTADMILGFSSEKEVTFFQRLAKALMPVVVTVAREWSYFPALQEITSKGLNKAIPSFKEIEKNASLLFMTSHYSLDDPRSFPPNTIPIGGIVVAKKKKPLPTEMEKFIESSPNGFIYISFGTIADFLHIEDKVQIEFINALKQFPDMRFVWKLQNDVTITKIPDNVMVVKWAPQQTILDHPKIKAFITHSGMGSTAEAVHFSVPLVCVPIMGDQDINADVIVKRGAGVKVEIVDMKQSQLENAIKEILHNKKYRDGMTQLTKIFKDRPQPPLENAVWWVEYVLRHDRINEYIVPPSVHQPWWKRRQVDVWLVVGALLISLPLTAIILLTCLIKKLCGGKAKPVKKMKKN